MASTIKKFVEERGIKYLVHFTRASNLDSILSRGLVPRNTLAAEGFKGFNDQYRIDGTHAVCLSIDFPNYKMFYGVRKDHSSETWVALVIKVEVLWDLDCAFCATNAASNSVRSIPLQQRRGIAALQGMYTDWPTKQRSELNLKDNYPTNPQAEVLVFNGVPRKYIAGIVTLNDTDRATLEDKHPNVGMKSIAQWFRWRNDYEHWK